MLKKSLLKPPVISEIGNNPYLPMFAKIMPTSSMKLGRASDLTSVLDNVLESFANYQAPGNNLLQPILSHQGIPICQVGFYLLEPIFYLQE
jgi:hypothetical protein